MERRIPSRRWSRRTFIRRAAACGLLAGVDARALFAAAERATVRGTVSGGAAPLPGVRVSDGRSVAVTDARGAYALEVGPESGPFLFVTTPAGFWAPVFFAPTAEAARAGRADFALAPCAQASRFAFVFMTDMHLENGGVRLEKFARSIAEINALGPAFVWAQGDICLEGNAGKDYVACLSALTMPVRNGAGNHEMLVKEPDPRAAFHALFGPTYYSFDWAGVHCVVLDGRDVRLPASDWRSVRGRVTARELAWLAADLAAKPKGMPVVAGVHIPLVSTCPDRRAAPPEDYGAWRIENAEEVHALLAANDVKLVLQGHVHENERILRDGVEYVATGAMAGSWWGSGAGFERGVDRAPRGYRVVEVDGAAIAHRFVSSAESHVEAAGECVRDGATLLPRRHTRLVFNVYDGASWAQGTGTIDGAAAGMVAPFAAGSGDMLLPHHFVFDADTSALAPGAHRAGIELGPGGAAARVEARLTIAPRAPIPVIHLTDLFHPHEDPDDHVDLACLFSMADIDLRAVILDNGPRQKAEPGRAAVAQLMAITGKKPGVAAGLAPKLASPRDTGKDQPAAFQGGVELFLRTLAESRVPVTVTAVGSMRDVAAAFNREPALCAEKIERLYAFIGDAHSAPGFEFREYNVTLDPHAFTAIVRSGLPVFWVPCFDGGPWQNNGRASFWQASQRALFARVADPVKRYFIYALAKKTGDPVAFLKQPVDPREWEAVLAGTRNLWCAGIFAHLADRAIVKADGAWRSLPFGAAGADVSPFAFERVRANVDASGMALYPQRLPWFDIHRFLVTDREAFAPALTSVTAEMLGAVGA
jgi:UDP-2,3-diacylglucosamine pyrophosphatase LpxH